MLLVTAPFMALARNQARALGLPNIHIVQLPHPMGGIPTEQALARLDRAFAEITEKLIAAPSSEGQSGASRTNQWVSVEAADDWSLQNEFLQRGWTDGLPVVAPNESRMAAMVDFTGLPAEQPIGGLPPALGIATVGLIAANAIMAGCRPAHMPVLLAAVRALCQPEFGLKNIQATTHPVTPLLILGGPLAETLNIHSGAGLFGPGPWANGALGRAIRLLMLNVGGGRPVDIDKATMGHPGKFSYCIAENEAASPWPSLRAERGFDGDISTVTLVGGEAPHNINDHESTSAGGLLTTICGSMSQVGQNNIYYPTAELLLVLAPEHAATIAAEDYSKEDVKRAVYEGATMPLSRFSSENIERRFWRHQPRRFKDRPLDTQVTVVDRWENILVLVAGGPGKHSMYIPTTGSTLSVTQPIVKADGSPWLPGDFQ